MIKNGRATTAAVTAALMLATPLARGENASQEPDRIAFTAVRDGVSRIFAVDPDGSGLAQITRGA
jgi:hypothetical protein